MFSDSGSQKAVPWVDTQVVYLGLRATHGPGKASRHVKSTQALVVQASVAMSTVQAPGGHISRSITSRQHQAPRHKPAARVIPFHFKCEPLTLFSLAHAVFPAQTLPSPSVSCARSPSSWVYKEAFALCKSVSLLYTYLVGVSHDQEYGDLLDHPELHCSEVLSCTTWLLVTWLAQFLLSHNPSIDGYTFH
jgi:hypothetical protein